ncbi:MAG: DUF3293 domain-containing protein [Pseudomonadales bacterium]
MTRQQQLIAAYEKGHYTVQTPALRFTLLIAQHSGPLARLHEQLDVSFSFYITAYNPHSELFDEADNQARQQDLVADVEALGLTYYPARAVDPQGEWPVEESILVCGGSLLEAQGLGQRYGQNAVVYNLGAVPLLLFPFWKNQESFLQIA